MLVGVCMMCLLVLTQGLNLCWSEHCLKQTCAQQFFVVFLVLWVWSWSGLVMPWSIIA